MPLAQAPLPRPARAPRAPSAALYLLLTLLAAGAARAQAPTVEPVNWINTDKTSVTNGVLTKVEGPEAWNAGASSSQKIESGDGYVEFNPGGQTNTWRMCGLSREGTDANYINIDYAIYTRADGPIHIFEKGVRVMVLSGAYAPNETLRVAVEGGRVKYYRNGALVYTSRTPPVYPLVADASIWSLGGVVANAVIARHVDTSGPAGTWYMRASRGSITNPVARLKVQFTDTGGGQFQGTMDQEGGGSQTLDSIVWDAATRSLKFRRVGSGWWQWFRGTIVEGVFAGRYTTAGGAASEPAPSAFTGHATAWNSTYIDANLTTRVYELLVNGSATYRARLRIDSSPSAPSGFTGRLKLYATLAGESADEQLEDDIEVTSWNGTDLTFVRTVGTVSQTFTGRALDRAITGTFTQASDPTQHTWSGHRAEVLTYGLKAKSDQDRGAWQTRTRRRLQLLMMGGNPAATFTESRASAAPVPMTSPPPDRDDNTADHPQDYTLERVTLTYTFADPHVPGGSLQRNVSGYLAVPTSPRPAGGWPAAIAVNGHAGSAFHVMNPNHEYFWYGDAIARRGYVVFAIDLSHRPTDQRRDLYPDVTEGDDKDHQNGPRPAVVSGAFAGTNFGDSDWEEDGERAWDVMRALDYLLSRTAGQPPTPLVDRSRVFMTGISMGGEVTMIVSALDHRISLSLPASYSPDMSVMSYHYQRPSPFNFNINHPCWRWLNADVREYVDTSDFHALVAPRPLVVQTGKTDPTYSARKFAPDKQVARRSRVAYNDALSNFLHYLHYDQHHYHIGEVGPTERLNVQVPKKTEPPGPNSTAWQEDPATEATSTPRTLFAFIQCLLLWNCGNP